jgi:sigma-B regulation protein RsbU (phosphoserine phosphatase)
LNGEVKSRGFDAITTAVVVGYHNTKRTLYFSYAGHPPAYVQRAGREWEALALAPSSGPTNLPLGILPKAKYDMENIRMEPGDRICLYTDGVTDCAGRNGEPFGEAGLAGSLNRNAGLSPSGLKTAVLLDLKRHLGDCPPDDDVTLLIAEIS